MGKCEEGGGGGQEAGGGEKRRGNLKGAWGKEEKIG